MPRRVRTRRPPRTMRPPRARQPAVPAPSRSPTSDPPRRARPRRAPCDNSGRPSPSGGGSSPVPVLATYFSVRRGRDPFFKFFMRTIFPRQVKEYEEKFGIRFLGWYNVAHGWDFDNVILLDLPDYATLDKLEKPTKPPGPSATGPVSGSSSATTRCSSASGWAPTSNTTRSGGRAMDASRSDRPRRASPPTPPSSGLGLPRQRHRPAAAVPRRQRDPDRRARRADPDRRRPGLPVDRARPDLPQPEPLPRRGDRRVGQRDRGHRDRPPSSSSSTTRPTSTRPSPRPPARPPACRPSPPAPRTCSAPPGSPATDAVGLDDAYAAAADEWAAGASQLAEPTGRGVGGAAAVRPGAVVPGAEPAVRGAPPRATSPTSRCASATSSAT